MLGLKRYPAQHYELVARVELQSLHRRRRMICDSPLVEKLRPIGSFRVVETICAVQGQHHSFDSTLVCLSRELPRAEQVQKLSVMV